MGRSDIRVANSFFGLVEKAVYTPTGSTLCATQRDYQPESFHELEQLLTAGSDRVADIAAGLKLKSVPVGNVRVEICSSRDGEFTAVLLLRFANYQYRRVGEPYFFTGRAAAVVAQALKK